MTSGLRFTGLGLFQGDTILSTTIVIVLVEVLSYLCIARLQVYQKFGIRNMSEENAEDPYQQEEDSIICRICLEEELCRSAVIAPCSCAGGSKFVHRACLDQWRTTREDRAFSRCTECLADYQLIPRPEYEEPEMRNRRRRKYIILMVRDIGGMFFLTQAIIIGIAFLVYAGDNHAKHLITQAHMLNYPRCFYYLTGLVITASIAGILGTVTMCLMGANNNGFNNVDCAYCFYGCGDSCSGCTCEGCTAGSCECGEAGPAVIVILGAFAVVGAIMIVVAGVMFVQQAMKNHASVLYKRGLAQEFVVADLDAPDGGISTLPPVTADESDMISISNGRGNCSDSVCDDRASAIPPSSSSLSHVYSSLASTSHGMDREEQGVSLVTMPGTQASAPPLVDSDSLNPSAPLLTLAQRQELARRGLI